MRYEIIFLFPFVFSLFGLQRMIKQKMKAFSPIEAQKSEFYFLKKWNLFLENFQKKIKTLHPFENDSFLLFLQKNLKKFSLFLLSLYNKIGSLNQKIICFWKKNCFKKKDIDQKPV
jgi:hypothetical protein